LDRERAPHSFGAGRHTNRRGFKLITDTIGYDSITLRYLIELNRVNLKPRILTSIEPTLSTLAQSHFKTHPRLQRRLETLSNVFISVLCRDRESALIFSRPSDLEERQNAHADSSHYGYKTTHYMPSNAT